MVSEVPTLGQEDPKSRHEEKAGFGGWGVQLPQQQTCSSVLEMRLSLESPGGRGQSLGMPRGLRQCGDCPPMPRDRVVVCGRARSVMVAQSSSTSAHRWRSLDPGQSKGGVCPLWACAGTGAGSASLPRCPRALGVGRGTRCTGRGLGGEAGEELPGCGARFLGMQTLPGLHGGHPGPGWAFGFLWL